MIKLSLCAHVFFHNSIETRSYQIGVTRATIVTGVGPCLHSVCQVWAVVVLIVDVLLSDQNKCDQEKWVCMSTLRELAITTDTPLKRKILFTLERKNLIFAKINPKAQIESDQ